MEHDKQIDGREYLPPEWVYYEGAAVKTNKSELPVAVQKKTICAVGTKNAFPIFRR